MKTMKAMSVLRGGILAATLGSIPVIASEMPAASAPPPPPPPVATNPATTSAKASIARVDPLMGKSKPLHYAAEPANALSAVQARVASLGPRNTPRPELNTLAVNPPLATYYLNVMQMANGASLETATTRGMDYVVMNAGQPYATVQVQVQNGMARAVGVRFAADNINFPDDEATTALAELAPLAAMDKVNTGSYEVRLIRSQPPISFSAIWLKADAGGTDWIYPLVTRSIPALHEHQLYSVEEFATAFKTKVRTSLRMPVEDPIWASDEQMHNYFVKLFIASSGFGMSRMGSPQMTLNDNMQLKLNGQTYGIDQLELIGIAKHDTPVAFVDRQHGVDTSRVPTRALTDFEQKALVQLRAGTNTVAQSEAKSRTVVGAIRAEESCLQCHPGAKTGDLLGAFSYHLYPYSTPAASTAAKAPPALK